MITHRAVFPANIETLYEMLSWVKERTLPMHFSVADFRKLEIAIEEMLVNIIHHAYREKKDEITLICQLYPNDRVELCIKDTGPPFNPLSIEKQILPSSNLENTEEGGLGIYLMRRFLDEVRYERQEPYNVLTLIKKIKGIPQDEQ